MIGGPIGLGVGVPLVVSTTVVQSGAFDADGAALLNLTGQSSMAASSVLVGSAEATLSGGSIAHVAFGLSGAATLFAEGRTRQFWTEERWIRITDNEDNVRFTGFNRTTTVGAEFARELREEEGLPPERIAQELQAAREKGEDLDASVTVNAPAAMDMDVLVETAPETVTIEQEQFSELANVISSGLELTDPRMKLLIRASQLRNKRELLDLIDGSQAPSDAQRAAGEIELATLKAQLDHLIAETEKTRAEGLKTLTEVDAMDGVIDGQAGGVE